MYRFSWPVRFSSTAAYWPARPICERSFAASRTTSKPATRAEPPSGRSSVVRMRTAVVLPAPLGPSRPSTVPFSAQRSTPSRARTSPYRLQSPEVSIAGAMSLNLAKEFDQLPHHRIGLVEDVVPGVRAELVPARVCLALPSLVLLPGVAGVVERI